MKFPVRIYYNAFIEVEVEAPRPSRCGQGSRRPAPGEDRGDLRMTRYYVSATWDDWPSGGSYGTIVEAESHEDAIAVCRGKMASIRADRHNSAEFYLENYSHKWHIVDCFDLDEFISTHQRKTEEPVMKHHACVY